MDISSIPARHTGHRRARLGRVLLHDPCTKNWGLHLLANQGDGSWKGSNGPVKNRDLWERLFGLVGDGRRDVTFVWIRGHAGDPNNHWVDQLARAAALSAG
jgi:ribonuclease HI